MRGDQVTPRSSWVTIVMQDPTMLADLQQRIKACVEEAIQISLPVIGKSPIGLTLGERLAALEEERAEMAGILREILAQDLAGEVTLVVQIRNLLARMEGQVTGP